MKNGFGIIKSWSLVGLVEVKGILGWGAEYEKVTISNKIFPNLFILCI